MLVRFDSMPATRVALDDKTAVRASYSLVVEDEIIEDMDRRYEAAKKKFWDAWWKEHFGVVND